MTAAFLPAWPGCSSGRRAGSGPLPLSLPGCLLPPAAGAPACPPALLAPSPRLSEEMAGPLGRGTQGAARCGGRGALCWVRSGLSWSSAGLRSDSGGGAEGTAPELLRGPHWFSGLGSVCEAGGHWLWRLCAPRSAPGFGQAVEGAGQDEGAAAVAPGRRGWRVQARRGEAGEARRGAAAAAATLLPPGLLLGSLARLLARAVRVQPAALRTQALGARSRTRPRREAPRWVLKSPDSAPPSQLRAEPASLNPGAGSARPAWLLLLWGDPPTLRPGVAPLDGRGLQETSRPGPPYQTEVRRASAPFPLLPN